MVGGNGDAFLIYQSGPRAFGTVIRFDGATATWGGAQQAPGFNDARIAIDDAGDAIAVYVSDVYTPEYDYEGTSLVAQRFDAATRTWTGAQTLDEFKPGSGSSPAASLQIPSLAVSLDPNGNGMVFWERVVSYPSAREIRSARYLENRNAWSAKPVPKISGDKTDGAALAADRSGNVNAVWNQFVGPYARTVAARYSSTTGAWSTPRVIQAGNVNTRDPGLQSDAQGNAFATWGQRSDSGTQSSASAVYRTTVARFSIASQTWGAPATIQDASRNGYYPYMGIDRYGRALIMWTQQSGRMTNGAPVKELRSDRVTPQ